MNPKIVCIGANIESETALRALISNGVPVVGVVTLPPRSSGGVCDYRDLHQLCAESCIPVIDTEDVNSADTVESIRSLSPDFIFVLGWSQLLREPLLSVPSGFVIGSHPTPLPQRRGRAPVPWTILEGHQRSAVTLFRIRAGVDNGPILLQRWFDISERAYALDVYNQVADELAAGFCELYGCLKDGGCYEKEQSHEHISYRAKRVPTDGHIDFSRTADEIDRTIRAVSEPFPGAYTYFEGVKYHIWRVGPYSGPERRGLSGQILARDGNSLIVQAKDKPIALSNISRDGEHCPSGMFPVGAVFGFRVEDTLAELTRRVSELERSLRNK